MSTLRKVLIANRGEIAARIARTCRSLGIETVAVYSDADQDAPFVTSCDQGIRIGGTSPAESYLDIDKIIHAARLSGADAIHPGFGFLSENPALPRACAEAGVVFVGPNAEVIAQLGSKQVAKGLAEKAGVPTIPGYHGEDQDDATLIREAESIGMPVLIKASAGGGGKGMRVVREQAALKDGLAAARREAESAFGDPTLLIEKYLERPRHIEIQILGDEHGNVVHLGERECSIQRRHQKIVEEAPSPAVDAALRDKMGAAALALAREVGYVGAGTVEFIAQDDGQFFFLEVNTRLQVEHPVTELVTGVDIVAEQLRIAEGQPLSLDAAPEMRGHAMECRLYAEDAYQGFLPQSGTLLDWRVPEVEGLRVDAALASGTVVSPHYDPMLAKLVTHGDARTTAIRRMRRALRELSAAGLVTNQRFLHEVLSHPAFESGELHTHFIDEHQLGQAPAIDRALPAIAVALADRQRRHRARSILPAVPAGFSNNSLAPERLELDIAGETATASYQRNRDGSLAFEVDGNQHQVRRHRLRGETIDFELGDGRHLSMRVAAHGDRRFVSTPDGPVEARVLPRFPEPGERHEPGSLVAPMPGKVVKLLVEVGATVEEGQPIAVLEAMKMEHQMHADQSGTVASVAVAEGDQLDAGQVLVVIEAAE